MDSQPRKLHAEFLKLSTPATYKYLIVDVLLFMVQSRKHSWDTKGEKRTNNSRSEVEKSVSHLNNKTKVTQEIKSEQRHHKNMSFSDRMLLQPPSAGHECLHHVFTQISVFLKRPFQTKMTSLVSQKA